MPVSATRKRVRATTLRLPQPLYDEARSFVEKEAVPGESINDFFVAAICAYLKMWKRKQIDAVFAGMAEDADYQKQAKLTAEEFGQSDWEALEIGEKDPVEE